MPWEWAWKAACRAILECVFENLNVFFLIFFDNFWKSARENVFFWGQEVFSEIFVSGVKMNLSIVKENMPLIQIKGFPKNQFKSRFDSKVQPDIVGVK